MLRLSLILIIFYQHFIQITANEQQQPKLNTIGSRLGDWAILPCGVNIKQMLPHDKNGLLTVPVLVNWFRHYSLTRKSDRPIFAKYLAHLIDYEPHIEREYENRLQIVDQINLNISSLKTTDEGIYECKLIFFDKAYSDNQNGSLVYLQIYVAPEFENLSDEVYYLKPHMPVRLYCYARGKPTPTITWYKNGKKLNLNSSLLYEASHENHEYDLIEYKCVAENIIDKIEHNFKVIKSGSLIFSEPLQNQTIVEGMLLNWPCLAQSNVDIAYKWFKDSIAVQSYLKKWSDRGAVFQDGMLYLSETIRDDAGYYECHAYTQSRRVQSRAYLNIIYPPEIIDFDSIAYALESSSTTNLECNTKANPAVHSYEWFKGDQLLSNNYKYTINSNGTLTIKHVKKSDHGEYYCTAQNTLKKVTSIRVDLIIVQNKKIDAILYAPAAQNIYKIPCRYSHLVTKWYKVGSVLPKGRYSIDQNGQLNIMNLNKADTGLYLCNHEQHEEISDEKLINYNHQKFIRLVIVENSTVKTSETDVKINKNLPIEAKNQLPLAPESLRVNQTSSLNEILITWSYPEHTKIKIEYYQLNYRHYNNKTSEASHSDWITIEPIPVTETVYSLNTNDLIENEYYQIQLLSYSIYSHSLPSEIITFKYSVAETEGEREEVDEGRSLINAHLEMINQMPSKTATLLKSVSQLDIILVTVFLFLVFILSICVLACIVYYRSNRYQNTNKRNKPVDKAPSNGELDDWGFQSSAGVTTTFLSSSPSPSSQLLTNTIEKKKTACPAINSHIRKMPYESRVQDNNNVIVCQTAIGESDSGSSNSTTILSSTNTNSTNITQQQQQQQNKRLSFNNNNRPSLNSHTIKIIDNHDGRQIQNGHHVVDDDDDDEDSEYLAWLSRNHPQYKQNFSVSIKNSGSGTLKRPIVQYPFKTTLIQQNEYEQHHHHTSPSHQINTNLPKKQSDYELYKKIQQTYNSLKVDYV